MVGSVVVITSRSVSVVFSERDVGQIIFGHGLVQSFSIVGSNFPAGNIGHQSSLLVPVKTELPQKSIKIIGFKYQNIHKSHNFGPLTCFFKDKCAKSNTVGGQICM